MENKERLEGRFNHHQCLGELPARIWGWPSGWYLNLANCRFAWRHLRHLFLLLQRPCSLGLGTSAHNAIRATRFQNEFQHQQVGAMLALTLHSGLLQSPNLQQTREWAFGGRPSVYPQGLECPGSDLQSAKCGTEQNRCFKNSKSGWSLNYLLAISRYACVKKKVYQTLRCVAISKSHLLRRVRWHNAAPAQTHQPAAGWVERLQSYWHPTQLAYAQQRLNCLFTTHCTETKLTRSTTVYTCTRSIKPIAQFLKKLKNQISICKDWENPTICTVFFCVSWRRRGRTRTRRKRTRRLIFFFLTVQKGNPSFKLLRKTAHRRPWRFVRFNACWEYLKHTVRPLDWDSHWIHFLAFERGNSIIKLQNMIFPTMIGRFFCFSIRRNYFGLTRFFSHGRSGIAEIWLRNRRNMAAESDFSRLCFRALVEDNIM